MEIKLGKIADNCLECEELVKVYYRDTPVGVALPDLAFKWDIYIKLEEVGVMHLITAREDGRLVGFALYAIFDDLQQPRRVCQCDSLCTDLAYRGKGIGRLLVEWASEWAKHEHKCTHIVHQYRTLYETVPLFEKMGFKAEEVVYRKEL